MMIQRHRFAMRLSRFFDFPAILKDFAQFQPLIDADTR
jgi:hypothetical protein